MVLQALPQRARALDTGPLFSFFIHLDLVRLVLRQSLTVAHTGLELPPALPPQPSKSWGPEPAHIAFACLFFILCLLQTNLVKTLLSNLQFTTQPCALSSNGNIR